MRAKQASGGFRERIPDPLAQCTGKSAAWLWRDREKLVGYGWFIDSQSVSKER